MRHQDYAPVALFAFRRCNHLQRAVESLLTNPEARYTNLFVYCDGPKIENQIHETQEVRAYAKLISGFNEVHIIEREENLGLAGSVISGVTDVISRCGTVIVVEDDLVLSPLFLSFMNKGLLLYQSQSKVASIHGYCYPTAERPKRPFFLRGADCWGWATWERAWSRFDPDGQSLLNQLNVQNESHLFDFGTRKYYTKMLQDQIAGKNDSWAIRWYASMFLAKMYTLYPAESYVANLGHDGSGCHCGENSNFNVKLAASLPSSWPEDIEESLRMRKAFSHFLNAESRGNRSPLNLGHKMVSFLKKIGGK